MKKMNYIKGKPTHGNIQIIKNQSFQHLIFDLSTAETPENFEKLLKKIEKLLKTFQTPKNSQKLLKVLENSSIQIKS
jgi:rRNA pseudouridine-1189 N-methylase Emg1 (Nep1/Mra1 family)